MEIKTICHGGKVTGTKQIERNGVPVGIVEGYIATWDVDRGDWSGVKDKFLPGAFSKSIDRHKKSGRPIRMKNQHNATIGGFPIDSVKEDDRGLFGTGEINLDVQLGRESFALAKQGVLTDFSIGWSLGQGSNIVDNVRTIPEAEIWEGSIVDEPMNPHANILAVKAVDFGELDAEDMRCIEEALRTGVKFSHKTARKIIGFLKAEGLLRDEPAPDDELEKAFNDFINICKGV